MRSHDIVVAVAAAARRLIFQIQKVIPWGDKKQRARPRIPQLHKVEER